MWGRDENAGFVIAAVSENDARWLASIEPYGKRRGDGWRDPTRSTCKLIGKAEPGVEGIILTDFHAG